MNMIQLVEAFNLFLAVLFTVAYFYQLVYLVIGVILIKRAALSSGLPGHLCGGRQLHRQHR